MKVSVLLTVCALVCGMAFAQDKPRVYVTDSNSWEVRSAGGGTADAFGGGGQGGARPQTAEIIKTFNQRCPDVVINNRLNASDYVVELDHEGGKGLLSHKDKIAVFVRSSGDSIFSKSTLSVGGSVQSACEAITKHWSEHAAELRAASNASSPQVAPVNASTTASKAAVNIGSNPTGADIEVDGNYVGSTPSTIQLGEGDHEIVVKKKAFQPWSRKIKVSGGSVNVNADLEPVSTTSTN